MIVQNKAYKRQTACIRDELDTAGVSNACKLIDPTVVVDDINTISQSEINNIFGEICSPECGDAILEAYENCGEIKKDEQFIVEFITSLCGTNKNGMRCYLLFDSARDHSSIEASCFDEFTNHGVCTCQPELLEEVEEQGCCLETCQDFFTGIFPDYDPLALYNECNVNRPEGCNNSPLGNSSVSLVSTITTTTAVIIAFMLALGYP